ncbi:dienelactone hydrolase family protein [Isoptericola dokdonensis]|uniref:Dienelactone hydrolase family protein n=1 Tax=Isoptericola dokdonensis DS-3 TaxID=1300344 RepID=A0A168ENQ6_9MICO|nr:dienelactone hydrolase family protein [Isoptericola dokdonensis]ANC30272.1 Dienelactone hydrolase family protein [Isoptericola dokdonensis DS-3]
MAEIVLFHHALGVTAGVRTFADALRGGGHVVHLPDLFDGLTFGTVEDGVAHAGVVGEDVLAEQAAAYVDTLPAQIVYGGMSMGAARAAEGVLRRPGARAAFFLSGAVAPSWWDAMWPDDVPSQAHVAADDPWREPEAEDEYVSAVAGGELFVYPGSGHLFAEPGHPDHDAEAAALATARVLELLGTL